MHRYQPHEAVKRARLALVYYHLLNEREAFRRKLRELLDSDLSDEECARRLHVSVRDLAFTRRICAGLGEAWMCVAGDVIDYPDVERIHIEGVISVSGSPLWREEYDRLLADFDKQVRQLRQELIAQMEAHRQAYKRVGFADAHSRYESEDDLKRKAQVLVWRLHDKQTLGQIAQKLDAPRSTVQRILNEARQVLQI